LVTKKTRERILEGKLRCKKCNKKFFIKNGTAFFVPSPEKQTAKKMHKLRQITLKQEIPKKWMRLFSKQELAALKKEWGWMSSTIKKGKGAVHLDFATGTGRFLRDIILRTKGEIIVLDYGYSTCLELQYFLKKIRKYSRVSIICANARNMPFRDGVFSSVSSWHGLDEPKMKETIKEARRVLKNGTWFTASGIHYKRESKSFLIAREHNIQLITKKSVTQTLKRVGFRKIQHRTFFQGRWSEKKSYLPVLGDFYSSYAIKAKKQGFK